MAIFSHSAVSNSAQQKMPTINILRAARSGDPDDAFAWWQIENGQLTIENCYIHVSSHHIQQINEFCIHEVFDIAAISSAALPYFADQYAVLSPGASVGRGYGPALAAREPDKMRDSLKGVTVAIPGELTTGALLLRLFYPHCKTVEMPFDQIAEAIAFGHVEAGVLIHEELMNWQDKGLCKLNCLGQEWMRRTGLPIPVGLNVVHRRLGEPGMKNAARLIRDSLVASLNSREKAIASAKKDSIQTHDGIAEEFIGMFANDDTMELKGDCREALALLYSMSYERGLIDCIPKLEIIEGLANESNSTDN